MRHLWQRIFAYALILVVVSQLAVILLHRYSVDKDEARRFISDYTRSLTAAIDGGNAASSEAILKIFNRRWERVWIEDESGALLAGVVPERVRPDKLETGAPDWDVVPRPVTMRNRPGKIVGTLSEDGPAMLETGDPDWYVAAMPVTLQEGKGTLYMLFGPPRSPGVKTLFFQGVIFMSVIGVLLACWISRRVSKPLRARRNEVMEIAAGNLDRRVTVCGHDEIADVAKAVNHMADSLAKHIRSMRELVANISHEMRSPLARMQVSLALLEEDTARDQKTAARLTPVNEELGHMNKLIDATLLTSKLDLQSPGLMSDAVAFSDLCKEACHRHAPLLSRKNLAFTKEIEDGILFPGDETLLSTLVSNLLDNAVKYTAENGHVFLRLFTDAENATLEVENDHAALPQETLDHIFEPFYRGGIATGNGVGLGLSLVRKIAVMHKGDAVVENTDRGVRFIIRFSRLNSAGSSKSRVNLP